MTQALEVIHSSGNGSTFLFFFILRFSLTFFEKKKKRGEARERGGCIVHTIMPATPRARAHAGKGAAAAASRGG